MIGAEALFTELDNNIYSLRHTISERARNPQLVGNGPDAEVVFQMMNRMSHNAATPEEHLAGLHSLLYLIPWIDDAGKKHIGNITVTPRLEAMMKSRVTATEVTGQDTDHWFSLPAAVKKAIKTVANPMFQLTDRCTVHCSMCGVADNGPTQKKLGMNGVINMMRNIDAVRYGYYPPQPFNSRIETNTFYWNTDPFDAKWAQPTDDGQHQFIYDYPDLADYYWDNNRPTRYYLYSSTAIPIGQELPILRFLTDEIARDEEKPGRMIMSRISITNGNQKRALALKNVLQTAYKKVPEPRIHFTDNRNATAYLAGNAWQEPSDVTYGDVIGITCRDQVVISPNGLYNTVMAGSSNEVPNGQLNSPLVTHNPDGTTTFSIVHQQVNSDLNYQDVSTFFPDTVYTCMKYLGENLLSKETVTDTKNPQRALLRVAATMAKFICPNIYYDRRSLRYPLTNLDAKTRDFISRQIRPADVHLIDSHLATGADNISMKLLRQSLIDAGMWKS